MLNNIECLIIVWVSAYLCQIMREVYAKDYLKILDKKEVQSILSKQGLEEKEIKKLLK
jgi:hypothetical protein